MCATLTVSNYTKSMALVSQENNIYLFMSVIFPSAGSRIGTN